MFDRLRETGAVSQSKGGGWLKSYKQYHSLKIYFMMARMPSFPVKPTNTKETGSNSSFTEWNTIIIILFTISNWLNVSISLTDCIVKEHGNNIYIYKSHFVLLTPAGVLTHTTASTPGSSNVGLVIFKWFISTVQLPWKSTFKRVCAFYRTNAQATGLSLERVEVPSNLLHRNPTSSSSHDLWEECLA